MAKLASSALMRISANQLHRLAARAFEGLGDIDQAGHVLDALHVARHPEQALGIAGQQRQVAAHRTASPAASPPTAFSSASTQVSFEPPPCEEFTTRLPAFIATRLNPPGSTQVSRPVTA